VSIVAALMPRARAVKQSVALDDRVRAEQIRRLFRQWQRTTVSMVLGAAILTATATWQGEPALVVVYRGATDTIVVVRDGCAVVASTSMLNAMLPYVSGSHGSFSTFRILYGLPPFSGCSLLILIHAFLPFFAGMLRTTMFLTSPCCGSFFGWHLWRPLIVVVSILV
jgi:hypothetical protein